MLLMICLLVNRILKKYKKGIILLGEKNYLI